MVEQEKPKQKKGFALLSKEERRKLQSKGGKKAHAMGVAHQFTPEEAREAGRKGGAGKHKRL